MHGRTRNGLLRIATALTVVAAAQVAASWTTASAVACTNPSWNRFNPEADVADYIVESEGKVFKYKHVFRRRDSGAGAGQLEYQRQTVAGDPNSMTNWRLIGDGIQMQGAPSAIQNRDGRMVVFITTDYYTAGNGEIYFKYELNPGQGDWSGWITLGGVGGSNPEATQNYDGRIEVFVRGIDSQIYHRWQYLNYNWNPDWGSFGGDFTDTLVRSESGRFRSDKKIVIHARGDDCISYSKWQSSPGGNWYPPTWWFQEATTN
ncbi:hypothetical protein J5X84_28635 [Streptosporangiaceae bacterium NEAU-GS5]|nr:hypothetical protein [Streptosporangiaceae bacterium NEAU-GS5]